jgi:hypothetical protein
MQRICGAYSVDGRIMFIEVQVHSEMHNKFRKVSININSIETFFDNIIICKGKEVMSCKETYEQMMKSRDDGMPKPLMRQ